MRFAKKSRWIEGQVWSALVYSKLEIKMTWHVQRLNRAKGSYYTAIFTHPSGEKRNVGVGYLPRPCDGGGSPPEPKDLTSLLRTHDPGGSWPAEVVIDAVSLFAAGRGEEEAVLTAYRMARASGALLLPSPPVIVHPPTVPPAASPAPQSVSPEGGGMTVQTYYDQIWEPEMHRKYQDPRQALGWWRKHLLPAFGHLRLIDLDARKWSAFLAQLKVSGPSKQCCQTIYRAALRHAETLELIPQVHKFGPVTGAYAKATAEPEPLLLEEVQVFLDAVEKPYLRALFGVHLGQGLRPAEAIRVCWEDIDWVQGTIRIRGTKNARAAATLPLTPLSRRELSTLWELDGKPSSGPCFRHGGYLGAPQLKVYPRQAFRAAGAKSGLNHARQRGLYPYVMRHSFATIAATSGIDRAFTKDMMRHSRDSKILDEAYIRVSKQQTAKAFAGFGGA